ncbi:MAG: hypothetical protein CVU48_09470 [Candidatus Cloacimonetes bacterium HGW-Cloacimonetes-1]|jgi:hypothetical protein|nr:MAG: hypothetical protein CVU48_09470 [Candidatus Cloacimonetes bacterium HGW-Cloacimonetes-1]
MENQRASYLRTICKIGLVAVAMISLFGCSGNVNKEAQQAFQARTEPFSVTIYPANIVVSGQIEHDSDLSHDAARFLEAELLAKPVLGNGDFSYDFRWGSNQAAMGTRTANAFAAQVPRDSISTDYAILVETLSIGTEANMGAIHFYIVDRNGNLVFWALTNSHWDEFNAIKPRSRQGGMEVAKLMFLKHLKQGAMPVPEAR